MWIAESSENYWDSYLVDLENRCEKFSIDVLDSILYELRHLINEIGEREFLRLRAYNFFDYPLELEDGEDEADLDSKEEIYYLGLNFIEACNDIIEYRALEYHLDSSSGYKDCNLEYIDEAYLLYKKEQKSA